MRNCFVILGTICYLVTVSGGLALAGQSWPAAIKGPQAYFVILGLGQIGLAVPVYSTGQSAWGVTCSAGDPEDPEDPDPPPYQPIPKQPDLQGELSGEQNPPPPPPPPP